MNINQRDINILAASHLLIGDQVPSKDVQSTVSDLEMRMRSCQTILNSIKKETPAKLFGSAKSSKIKKIQELDMSVRGYMNACKKELTVLKSIQAFSKKDPKSQTVGGFPQVPDLGDLFVKGPTVFAGGMPLAPRLKPKEKTVAQDQLSQKAGAKIPKPSQSVDPIKTEVHRSIRAAQDAQAAMLANLKTLDEPNPNEVGRLVGITNMVNTCYMNAALQPLFGISGISERVSEQLARALASKDRDTAEAEANLQSSIASFTIFNTNPANVQKYIQTENRIKKLVEQNRKEAAKPDPLIETMRSNDSEIERLKNEMESLGIERDNIPELKQMLGLYNQNKKKFDSVSGNIDVLKNLDALFSCYKANGGEADLGKCMAQLRVSMFNSNLEEAIFEGGLAGIEGFQDSGDFFNVLIRVLGYQSQTEISTRFISAEDPTGQLKPDVKSTLQGTMSLQSFGDDSKTAQNLIDILKQQTEKREFFRAESQSDISETKAEFQFRGSPPDLLVLQMPTDVATQASSYSIKEADYNLDLTSVCEKEIDPKETKFELVGACFNHDQIHWTASAKRDSEWFHFDDSEEPVIADIIPMFTSKKI